MNWQGFNHLVQVLCTTLLCLFQNSNLAIEVFDLFILLFAIRLKVSIVDIQYFDRDSLGGCILASVEMSEYNTVDELSLQTLCKPFRNFLSQSAHRRRTLAVLGCFACISQRRLVPATLLSELLRDDVQ